MAKNQKEFARIPAGMTRRSFVKTCITATASMGLQFSAFRDVAHAAVADDRPPVVWLHFQECTGCSETLLRSSHPDVAALLFDILSLDYHETLMAGAGKQAEHSLEKCLTENRGKYILVVEGAIPLKENGIYCKVAGKTALASLKEAASGAAAILCIGTCASYGGVQAAEPNPTGAVGVQEIVTDKPIINVPGCPPSPYNLLSTILYLQTFKKAPPLDELKRPSFAYGRTLHEHCERRPHFDSGRFAESFGDESHKSGHCLYKLGCKGPITFANCSVQRFNDAGVWPVSVGHPCIGCTEPKTLFRTSIYDQVPIHLVTPPDTYPPATVSERGKGADPITAGVVGLVAGAALGGGVMVARQLPKEVKDESDQ